MFFNFCIVAMETIFLNISEFLNCRKKIMVPTSQANIWVESQKFLQSNQILEQSFNYGYSTLIFIGSCFGVIILHFLPFTLNSLFVSKKMSKG